ncbi:MAG: dihydroorotate dehydrogenase electron transfer subunit [Treponema sp.]|nr:dihydroorotate dehydrogenase electron transfer subunit [Treponema sp.]
MSGNIICELVNKTIVNEEYFILQFTWSGIAPKAGQFFMLKPLRSSVFLSRPFAVFDYLPDKKIVKFLICRAGKGTVELAGLHSGDKARLTGPFGNCWEDFLPNGASFKGKAALVGGSAGVAPLAALVSQKPGCYFHFFAGFKKGFREKEHENAIMGAALKAHKFSISAEDGGNALNGKIVDFIFEPESFDVILACGPMGMLKALWKKCEPKNVSCFFSLESRFACGAGVCLGCTIHTVNGNRRCCKDGPIFPAADIIFNE